MEDNNKRRARATEEVVRLRKKQTQELFEAGKSANEIAQIIGVSKQMIGNYMQFLGLSFKERKRREILSKITDLRNEGKNRKQIAEELGISSTDPRLNDTSNKKLKFTNQLDALSAVEAMDLLPKSFWLEATSELKLKIKDTITALRVIERCIG